MNQQTFRNRVFRAGGLTIAAHIVAQSLRLIGSLILTRIFSPEVFGVLGIITSISIVMSLLTDFGIRQAVVQSPSGSKISFVRTAWTMQIVRGFIIWILAAALAALLFLTNSWNLLSVESVYADPQLPALIVAASFSAAILGFQSMKAVAAGRNLELSRVFAIELLSQGFSLSVAIVLALLTQSIWSYIVALNLAALLAVLLGHFYLKGDRDGFAWDRVSLKELSGFGRWVLASSSVSAFAMNGDKLLLAGWVNSATFGFYSIANNLISVVDVLASRFFGTVTLATLSEINRTTPDRFSGLYSRMRWISDLAIISFAGFLYSVGPFVVSVLYDERYISAGGMLQWLSFGVIFLRYGLSTSAYLALGKPRYVTMASIAKLICLFTIVPALFLGFGFEGALLGIAFHMLPVAFVYYAFDRSLGISNAVLELTTLGAWPVGWMLGQIFVRLAQSILSVVL